MKASCIQALVASGLKHHRYADVKPLTRVMQSQATGEHYRWVLRHCVYCGKERETIEIVSTKVPA